MKWSYGADINLWNFSAGKDEDADFRSDDENYYPIHDVGFDPNKCCNCTIDNNETVVHGPSGGRGYALGNIGFTQGAFLILILYSFWNLELIFKKKKKSPNCTHDFFFS